MEKEDEKRLRQVLLCLTGAFILTLAVLLLQPQEGSRQLTRPEYGQNAREVLLNLSMEDREFQIPLELDSHRYLPTEMEERWQEAWDMACETALGDNEDWNHVRSTLNFQEKTGVAGIEITWSSGDPSCIRVDGTIGWETVPEEGKKVLLTAELTYEDQSITRQKEVTVLPPLWTEDEKKENRLREALEKAAADRSSSLVELPEEMDGKTIIYRNGEKISPGMILILGILLAAALWMLPEQRRKEALERRNRELSLSYSELVWKMTVLMGAGLTVRGSWERILQNYQKNREKGAPAEVLYEEMLLARNAMSQGIYEEKAYAEFGKRCGLPSYLRLASLLETNVRQGRKGLTRMMQAEAAQALEERILLARTQGEEASSRLLLPMLLLFALVLVLLIVPALSSMQVV